MVAGAIHISDQFELNQESAAEQDETRSTTDWNTTPEVGKCQEDSSSRYYVFFSYATVIQISEFHLEIVGSKKIEFETNSIFC